MKFFVKILLFVFVALITNVKVTSATITFPNIQQSTTSISSNTKAPKTFSKISENYLANCCQNEQYLVDYRSWGIGVIGNAAKGGSRVFEVGSYNTLKGVEAGLEAHHVGQRALMKKFIPGYNANTAPSILVPKQGHTLGNGVLSRGTSGFSNARQVLARDIFELRRVYPNVPNSSLQQLIQMNKTMYPGAFIK